MSNNPINSIDPDGGWSFGLTGSLIGSIIGATTAHLIIKNNPQMDDVFKIGLSIGLPLAGAGLGYGAFESLSPGSVGGGDGYKNENPNFWMNTKAFYAGLFGRTSDLTSNFQRTGGHSSTVPPNIWGWAKGVKIKWVRVLPKWNLAPRNEEPSDFGIIWRIWLTFNPPVIPAYLLLREILRIPIPYKKR